MNERKEELKLKKTERSRVVLVTSKKTPKSVCGISRALA
jgi:hypothetical protein